MDIPGNVPFDPDRLTAAIELIGRAAARSIELGWIDDAGPKPGDWYASAAYRGARVTVEHQLGPDDAAEALAFKLMEGGQCVHCGHHLTVPGVELADGSPSCQFHREGPHWLRGCDDGYEAPPQGLNREQRRRQAKALRLR